MFPKDTQWLFGVHVLDLEKNGYIGPHVDSIKFSGSILSGLCLLSTCVMTLKNEKTGTIVDLLLKPRMLYIMRGGVRFDYSHEVHSGIKQWKDQSIERDRRISIMFRNEVEQQHKDLSKKVSYGVIE
jgi:alkylated DNA repair protein alkB family protein 7